MQSLHHLWKSLHLQTESRTKLRSFLASSVQSLSSKSKPPSAIIKDPSHSHSSPQSASTSSPNAQEVAADTWHTQPLSAAEALSRLFATPSVHGPVWQSFGHHQNQVCFDKIFVARPEEVLFWKLTSSYRKSWPGRQGRVEKLDKGRIMRLRKSIQQIPVEITAIDLICNSSEDSAGYDNDRPTDESDSIFQAENMTFTSMASDASCIGPCMHFVNALLIKAIQAVSDVSSIQQLGLMMDMSSEHDSLETKKNERDSRLNNKGLHLLSGACYLPHPAKAMTGGEDAYFICSEKAVIGVADGVGGWADMGVDAGEYARQLMKQSLLAACQEPRGCIDTARVLQIAHSKTICQGSSTACILALSNHGLQAANLGDSGFLVVRNGRVIFKSPAQQHNFNFPYQLESGGGDPPTAAEVFSVDVDAGDVIVAGTDGLFDNLFDAELTSAVMQAVGSGFSPEVTAQKIASLARERAQDCDRQTPFSTAAQDAGFRFYGGKMDDITVIVSFVTTDTMAC